MNLDEEMKESIQLAALTEQQWRDMVWAKLTRIEASSAESEIQSTRTNGRVTKLEAWRNMAIGALAVITAVVIPIFLKVVQP